jgi:hypothetical protein
MVISDLLSLPATNMSHNGKMLAASQDRSATDYSDMRSHAVHVA